MRNRALLFIVLLNLAATPVWSQSAQRTPDIGYVYPAGGEQGSTVQVLVGGQYLRAIQDAQVSGDGVSVSVLKYYKPMRNLDKEQRFELHRRFRALRQKRLDEMPEEQRPTSIPERKWVHRGEDGSEAIDSGSVELPEHPLLENLEEKSLRELISIADTFFERRKLQKNKQLDEMIRLELRIDKEARPGNREFRLKGPNGLTNALCFQINRLPEYCEEEPNGPRIPAWLPEADPIDTPLLMNGQIMPGDVDRFAFRAKAGEKLVIKTQARALTPFLADAVPGWFQATLSLYDENLNEIAFADDFRFNPDPVLYFPVPEEGVYYLEIRDSIYRGRQDFVYRIAISEAPFITQHFPLGARQGAACEMSLAGWNLSQDSLALDTRAAGKATRWARIEDDAFCSNEIPYVIDDLPESLEQEANNALEEAQPITLPRIINGRIDAAGDSDFFRIDGEAGAALVLEVEARRLHSPLDSLVQVLNADGEVIAWNDDYNPKDGHLHLGPGWCTHHADSYLSLSLPETAPYFVRIADAQTQGGAAYAYRLRISEPQPDFEVYITPSSLNCPPGLGVPITAHLVRKDGFEGAVEVCVLDEAAEYQIHGGQIPAGKNTIRMTLSTAGKVSDEALALQLEAFARIGEKEIRHAVLPADDTMQAFLYRHLVGADTLWLSKPGKIRRRHPVRLRPEGIVDLSQGAQQKIVVNAFIPPHLRKMQLALHNPPKGIQLETIKVDAKGIKLWIKNEAGLLEKGFRDNLLIEASIERKIKNAKNKTGKKSMVVPLGFLPAIPIEMTP